MCKYCNIWMLQSMTIKYSVLASPIFLCLFLLVAVAILGYLGVASHYIVRDKNCVVLIIFYCAKLARANFYAYCVSILFITLWMIWSVCNLFKRFQLQKVGLVWRIDAIISDLGYVFCYWQPFPIEYRVQTLLVCNLKRKWLLRTGVSVRSRTTSRTTLWRPTPRPPPPPPPTSTSTSPPPPPPPLPILSHLDPSDRITSP